MIRFAIAAGARIPSFPALPGIRSAAARSVGGYAVALAAGFIVLALLAIATPPNHDESQYVAAVAAMSGGLPFRDFAYLQTPLQPLLLAPLAMLEPGWLFIALRLANALMAAATMVIVDRCVRRNGGSPRAALAAAIALLCADAFIFAGVVARNDALPMLLFTGGLAFALRIADGRATWRAAACAGLLIAAAASAKISYALPGVAVGALLAWHLRAVPRMLPALAAGALIGALPTLAFVAIDFRAFWFGVIDYSLHAPQQWRELTGQVEMLSPWSKIVRLTAFAALGLPLLALALIVIDRLRGGGRSVPRDPRLLMLDVAILAGVVAAYLPDPSFRQYLVPILPPLFIRLGLTLHTIAPRWRGMVAILGAAFLVAGLVRPARHVAATLTAGAPVAAILADAQAVAALVGPGPIVTLAPDRIAGAGVLVDRRFVAGPFLYRIDGALAKHAMTAIDCLPFRATASGLDAQPPVALVTGAERKWSRRHPKGLDAILEDWARTRGYRRVALPSGTMWLWLAP